MRNRHWRLVRTAASLGAAVLAIAVLTTGAGRFDGRAFACLILLSLTIAITWSIDNDERL